MKIINKLLFTSIAALGLSLSVGTANAAYPEKPIQVVVPYGAGGDSDLSTRIVADAVEKELGVPVVVVNKPGGGGVVGTSFVANSKSDGYTLINIGLGNMFVAPHFRNAAFNYPDSWSVMGQISSAPFMIAVAGDSKMNSLSDVATEAAARKAAGKDLTLATWAGSGEVLAGIVASADTPQKKPFEFKFIKGNSAAEAAQALLGGHVDLAFVSVPAVRDHIKSGKLKVIAINQKIPGFEDAPTFKDSGINANIEGWAGFAAPKGVTDEVVTTWIKALDKAMARPEVLEKLRNIGVVPNYQNAQQQAWLDSLAATNDAMKAAAEKAKAAK